MSRPGVALLTGGASVVLAGALLRRRPPGGARRWERTNHAGHTVSLLEGPALVAGCAALAVVAPVPAATATAAGAAGLLDDLLGDAGSKGLRGHLGALARGELTTGTVKVAVLGAAGLGATLAIDGGMRGVPTLSGAALVAGAANLLNLFDLRPGRALKVALVVGVPCATAGSAAAAGLTGASLAALPADLGGRSMMGDTGANALGALAGAALVERLGVSGRLTALAVVTTMTLASERVSFSRVIARTPVLRELDAWGRATA